MPRPAGPAGPAGAPAGPVDSGSITYAKGTGDVFTASVGFEHTGGTGGSGTGTTVPRDLALTRPVDGLSADLQKRGIQGAVIPTVTIVVDRPGSEQPAARYVLTQAFVDDYRSENGTESLSLSFRQIQVTTFSPDGTSSTYTWNTATSEIS